MSFRFRGSNASSGMGVADHGKNAFLQLKRKKVHRYVIFKIDEKKKEVVVEKTGTPAESFDDFTASLPKMIADTRCMTLILRLPRIAKKARYSLFIGLLQHLVSVRRCYTPPPKTHLKESWMVFIMRFRLLIPQKLILKC